MVIENKYLRKAIEKTKYIVLVKRILSVYRVPVGICFAERIEIDMNVEMLNKEY